MAPETPDPAGIARDAAAAAALELVQPAMTLGLGSGRAVWRLIDAIAARWPEGAPIRAAVASERTDALARDTGIEIVELDGRLELDLAVDGADEVDPELRLLKGGGGALLREKIVVAAARRFVVVAEATKRVNRLGERFPLPVEVVRFGWRDTRRRLAPLLPDSRLRAADDGPGAQARRVRGNEGGPGGEAPYITDEGHYLLDCALPANVDPVVLDSELRSMPGVVEHGLFIGVAERALLGRPDGGVEEMGPH